MIFTHTAITRHLTAWCAEHMGHEGPGMRAYQRIFDRNLAVKRAAQLLHHDNGGVRPLRRCPDGQRYARSRPRWRNHMSCNLERAKTTGMQRTLGGAKTCTHGLYAT